VSGVQLLPTRPSHSPDLSPIETLWALLARKVQASAPWGEAQIWECVEQALEEIADSTRKALWEEFPLRLELC
jgi:hypothetical protein